MRKRQQIHMELMHKSKHSAKRVYKSPNKIYKSSVYHGYTYNYICNEKAYFGYWYQRL